MNKSMKDTVTIRIEKPTTEGQRLIRSLTPSERTIILVEAARKQFDRAEYAAAIRKLGWE